MLAHSTVHFVLLSYSTLLWS